MPYDPEKHHRRSIRLKGYDYSSAGAYFITLCTYQRECIFGEIMDGAMHLNPYGMLVAKNFQWLSERYPYVHLDEWVIMPNHLHGILVLNHQPGRGVLQNAPTNVENTTTQSEKTPKHKSLGRLIGAFKTQPNGLTSSGIPPEPRFGNAIIMNGSSEMNGLSIISVGIFR